MDVSDKEVRFDIYCPKCKNKRLKGEQEPWNTCLETNHRYGTEKPELFEEDTNNG